MTKQAARRPRTSPRCLYCLATHGHDDLLQRARPFVEEQRFDIVFRGVTRPGTPRETVAAKLSQLFRVPPETVARLFGGGTHTLKRGLDADEARHYQEVLASAGAMVQLQLSEPDPATSSALTLAPAGSDLLAPHERRQTTATAPDTSHLSLAEPGVRLGTPTESRATPPDTSHLSLAPLGAPLDGSATTAPAG